MSFPSLVPAFTARVSSSRPPPSLSSSSSSSASGLGPLPADPQIPIKVPFAVGTAKAGGLNMAPFVSVADGHGGALVSEPGYAVRVDAQFVHGADYIRADPDGQHLRLDVHSLMQQRDDPAALLRFSYTGTIAVTPALAKVLAGAADAASTPFGSAFTHVVFESGHPALQPLEHKTFVGSGRFVLEAGQPIVVEYKISEVVG